MQRAVNGRLGQTPDRRTPHCILPCRTRSLIPEVAGVQEVRIERCLSTGFYVKIQEAVEVNEGVYMRPKSMTEGSVDSLRQPCSLYQISCAEEHDIKIQGLRRALAVMKEQSQVTLYLVVPDDRFEEFRVKGLKKLKSKLGKDLSLGTLSIKVLEIRYEQL